jgi:23S rRNA (guanosine2251-2'-O)-methyltransferase
MMRKLSMEELNRVSLEQYQLVEKIPVVCILDNIRSQHNIGSIFRTADAFSVEKIYLCGITATPPNREISKTALGATESVPWQYVDNTNEIIVQLKSEGYVPIAIEQAEGSVALKNFTPEAGKKYALIFGNEVMGVDDSVMQLVDTCLEIPQMGTKHSLNVSITAGIVLYYLFSKFR